jgi:hypothetical protein
MSIFHDVITVKSARTVLTAAGVLGALAATVPITQALSAQAREAWKGADSMTPIAIGPDISRCGPAPASLRAQFAGTGIDNTGGPYTVTASGCLNTETQRVSQLRATDTYIRSGDSVDIATDDFTLAVNPDTCVATNERPVRFTVAGGSGSLEDAGGQGRFHFAMPYPLCAGVTPPLTAYVWFEGTFQR